MGRLIIGPAAKINNGFVPGVAARPLNSTIDQAILWHRGSLAESRIVDPLPVAGARGPQFWDGFNWGSPGNLARFPRVLFIIAADVASVSDWLGTNFADSLFPKRISVVVKQDTDTPFGNFPFLVGVPVLGGTQVDQPGSAFGTILVPDLVSKELFIGGSTMVATITESRCQFRPTGTATAGGNGDYITGGVNTGTEVGGYTQYPSSPTASRGFTTADKDAADHVRKLALAAARFAKFQNVFYQANVEADGPAAESTTSIVPDLAIDSLMGGSPYLSRKAYAPGLLSAILGRVLADAIAFFS